jgi:hypothetical protein
MVRNSTKSLQKQKGIKKKVSSIKTKNSLSKKTSTSSSKQKPKGLLSNLKDILLSQKLHLSFHVIVGIFVTVMLIIFIVKNYRNRENFKSFSPHTIYEIYESYESSNTMNKYSYVNTILLFVVVLLVFLKSVKMRNLRKSLPFLVLSCGVFLIFAISSLIQPIGEYDNTNYTKSQKVLYSVCSIIFLVIIISVFTRKFLPKASQKVNCVQQLTTNRGKQEENNPLLDPYGKGKKTLSNSSTTIINKAEQTTVQPQKKNNNSLVIYGQPQ